MVQCKAWLIASKFRNNRLIVSYRSEAVRPYILEIEINVEISEFFPFLQGGKLEITYFTMYSKFLAVSEFARGFGYVESESGIDFTVRSSHSQGNGHF